MPVHMPTRDELFAVAASLGLHLSDAEADMYSALMKVPYRRRL